MFYPGIVLHATDINNPFSDFGELPQWESESAVDTASIDQQRQIERIAPIKYCTNPEFYLAEIVEKYMPQGFESDKAYETRITRAQSAFEPFYDHLRNLIVGTALRKGIDLKNFSQWETFVKNVDLEGSSLLSFTKKNLTDALDGGIAAIWVEYPKVPANLRADQEDSLGLRPYFVSIKCEDILEVRSEIFAIAMNGVPVLGRYPTHVRLVSTYSQRSESNPYVVNNYPAVRVYDLITVVNPVTQLVDKQYVKWTLMANLTQDSEDYQEVESGFLSIPFIPFVPSYGGRVEAYCRARPQLLDVARSNLHYWVICADLAYKIHNSSNDQKWATGVRNDDDLTVESDRILTAENPDASFGILSPEMNGAEVTLSNLARIERTMERLAAVAVATSKTQAESGFSKLLDRSQSDSQLAIIVQSLEDTLRLAFQYASYYYENLEPPEVSISKDFIPVKLHSQQIMAYINLFKETPMPIRLFLEILNAGEIYEGIPESSTEELLKEMKLTGNETYKDLFGVEEVNDTANGELPVQGSVNDGGDSDAAFSETPEAMRAAPAA